jgi:hypothetical protein
MLKISECKELVNPQLDYESYEFYIDLMDYIDNKELNKIYKSIKGYTTIKLKNKSRKNDYCIIHKSAKKINTIQLSYFDNKGAYADKETTTIKDALTLIYKSYKVESYI